MTQVPNENVDSVLTYQVIEIPCLALQAITDTQRKGLCSIALAIGGNAMFSSR